MASAPRWQSVLSKVLAEHPKSTVIQLATIDANNHPHVRSHIFRAFLFALSNNQPLLLSSTDIRTPKVSHIIRNSNVEVAWWIEPTQEQFRITGAVVLVPTISHPFYEKFKATLTKLVGEDFDWEKKRKEMFNDLSGHMRASWCRPVPGTKLEGGYEKAKEWPEKLPKLGDPDATEDEKKDLEIALGNFALVVIEPKEVDYLELGIVPNQRTRFTRGEKQWAEEIVVP